MDKPSFKLVGAPCGQHGQYTFYKALRVTGEKERIIAIGDFFFVRIWQDSELVSVGELQLLWTDRVSDQTLVSLRLYFLPENTPDGRNQHGQDEVLAINDKVVLKAEDLLSWVCCGADWRWGLRAVWRGACAPPATPRRTQPLHHTRLDFSDVDREKSAITEDADSPGVVVFSYPRYCRYRALLARLEGIQGDWLRDSLVCALGGYAAPTRNTRILYCKDTFEYPELEGHEFVCNQLAPKLKGRPRGRRRRRADKHSPSPSDRSSDSDEQKRDQPDENPRRRNPRRLSLRNGAPRYSDDVDEDKEQCGEDRAFLHHLKQFFRERKETFKPAHSLKDLSLRTLYQSVINSGGYDSACRHKLWRQIHAPQPNTARRHYERFLLALEKHEVSTGVRTLPKLNGTVEQPTLTIELPDSREPSPAPKEELKDFSVTSKPAEELNREFLESLPPKDENKVKISVKPVEKLLEEPKKEKEEPREEFYSELKNKLNLVAGNAESKFLSDIATPQQESVTSSALSSLSSLVNGHTLPKEQSRPPTRSSLRHVRVKPARAHHSHHHHHHTTTAPHHHQPTTPHHHQPHVPASNTPLRSDSASSSPPAAPAASSAPATPATPTTPAAPATPAVTNFGIHHPPPPPTHSDDEIVEVPYKPKTPEIIDLDEYPESPQAVKKKKLDILKERGLEVTAIPTTPAAWPPTPTPLTPLVPGASLPLTPLVLSPAVQHQIMTQAQIFQMYNIIPPNYPNGTPPKVIQATSAFGSSGPEKTVYGNPKDPFMPPPHVLLGTPMKPQRNSTVQLPSTPPQDILDLTCKTLPPGQKPAVEIVRIPSVPSPSKTPSPAQNLTKNYTLADGKAIVGSNLEITLVNPKSQTPTKSRQQKRSSNGKFVAKTPTPPKDYPKSYTSPSQSGAKKPPIIVPNYQVNQRDDVSPTSSTGSGNSQTNLLQNNLLQNVFKGQNSLQQMMEMQKNVPTMPYVDPYMSALYSSLAGGMDQRQLAMYRDFMANQFRGYSGLLGVTPTTKN